MTIKNQTKNRIIGKNCKRATTLLELTFGLHWISNPPELLFKTRFGIHTLMLKKPIDVLVMSDEFRVMSLRESLKPNRFYFWNPKYQWVLELPAGAVGQSKTAIGDKLNFDPQPET